ncbi:GIY-YIG nuclease family protein [Williamsia sp.]|uniref:GIY-YIG nuclease family protein n=1 Tax=Williamsia sp. TaxID=1872085 RepID=UPI001A307CE8|nr:GIY-YIG nuclease family protein [Williamsia sp.]MBJ7289182.1 GIY-YIG nuclease family protein [Williamsia sp.]
MSKLRNDVDRWADREGFSPAKSFAGIKTPVGGDPAAKQAGFYLLTFGDDTYYVGESVNLRSRMGGHNLKWGREISDVRFLRRTLSKQQLRAYERSLIHGINKLTPDRCRNIAHAGIAWGLNELEELLSVEDQDRWLADPAKFNADDQSGLKPMENGQAVKYSTAASNYLAAANEPQLTALLRGYLESCVPVPRQTEFHGWSVSTGSYSGKRAFCVCVGMMETFAVQRFGDSFGGFVVVRKSLLVKSYGSLQNFRRAHPRVVVKQSRYQDAGADTLNLLANDPESLSALLADAQVLSAGAQLVQEVMRKHPCTYTRYHCPQLVERVYPESSREALDVAVSAEPEVVDNAIETEVTEELPAGAATFTTFNENVPDDVPILWLVNTGTKRSGLDQVDDFIARSEWRTTRNPKWEMKVQDMRVGERIAVRRRYNVKGDAPFGHRGYNVSTMEFLLRGTITDNPGNGVSVSVDWEPIARPTRRWYLFTSQDTVWAVPRGLHPWHDLLFDFVLDDNAVQDLDFWRNQRFWAARFGDSAVTS